MVPNQSCIRDLVSLLMVFHEFPMQFPIWQFWLLYFASLVYSKYQNASSGSFEASQKNTTSFWSHQTDRINFFGSKVFDIVFAGSSCLLSLFLIHEPMFFFHKWRFFYEERFGLTWFIMRIAKVDTLYFLKYPNIKFLSLGPTIVVCEICRLI